MSAIESKTHPFGQKLQEYLQQAAITQAQLAQAIEVDATVISHMKRGKRLTGEGARERVLKIIEAFYEQDVLTTRQQADDFLATAGMLPLSPDPFDQWCLQIEPKLYDCLQASTPLEAEHLTIGDLLYLLAMRLSPLGVAVKKFLRTIPVKLSLLFLISLTAYMVYTNGWSVHIKYTDDRSVILVNEEIVFVDKDRRKQWPPRIVTLAPYLYDNQANRVSFVNLNGLGPALWNVELHHRRSPKWHILETTPPDDPRSYQMAFTKTLLISPNGYIEPEPHPRPNLVSGSPVTMTVEAKDIAVILVNGFPVGGAFNSPTGEFLPINIRPYLVEGQDNDIEVKFWADRGEYYWQATLEHDNERWQCQVQDRYWRSSTFTEKFIFTATDKLIYQTPDGNCYQ